MSVLLSNDGLFASEELTEEEVFGVSLSCQEIKNIYYGLEVLNKDLMTQVHQTNLKKLLNLNNYVKYFDYLVSRPEVKNYLTAFQLLEKIEEISQKDLKQLELYDLENNYVSYVQKIFSIDKVKEMVAAVNTIKNHLSKLKFSQKNQDIDNLTRELNILRKFDEEKNYKAYYNQLLNIYMEISTDDYQ